MKTATLNTLPRNINLGITFALALVLAVLAQINLQRTFALVEHPVSLAAANLESDPDVLRGWYALLLEQGTYLQMIRTELVDIFWAILFGVTLVSLYRFVGGLLRSVHPPIATGLVRWAPLAAIGPAFDIIENGFSLAMLTDPTGFPDWWAVAHTAASWLKLIASGAAAIIGPVWTVIALIDARRSQKGLGADS